MARLLLKWLTCGECTEKFTRPQRGLCATHDWSGASFRSVSPLGATKVSVSSSPDMTVTESNQS
jgi:hypothetical protein